MALSVFIAISISFSCMSTQNIPVIDSQLLFDGQASLGEGALWNHETQTFWWVDIEGGLFHIYNPQSKENTTYPVHQRIGTVVPDVNGNAIVALQDGIYRLFLADGKLELLAKADYDPTKFRFNDGKCDPAGRLWVGTMALDGSRETAALYRFDTDYKLTRVLEGVTISNGIVWSADKTKMYYIDTPTQQVKEFHYNLETGEISFSRIAVEIQRELGHPDGMTIDENDRLWIGHWAGYAVYCWDPYTGDLISKIDVAAKNITSCDFGGQNLNQLFITSASVGMSAPEKEQLPHSGGLFIATPGVRGTKSFFFGKK
jgi:sugar lactone lactonase YvrE